MADRTVVVNLKANTSQFKSAMGDASSSMTSFDKAQARSQANAEKWRVVGQASQVAGATLAAGLLATTKAASDQEQAFGALDAVFKSNSASMRENAAAAVNIGLSQTDYANSAAKLGSQLTNLGMSQSDVAGTTDDLITKAADMAAQFGGPTSQAVDAISAALRGERDPIEQYGISLTDAGIKAEMAATGMDKMGATLSLIQKQMASSNTLGAAAREFDTTAAATARARAEFDNAAAALGTALLPAMTAAANAVGGLLGKFNSLPPAAQTATTYVAAFGAAAMIAGPKIVAMASTVSNLAASLAAAGKLVGPITAVTSAITAMGAGLAGLGFIKGIEALTNKVGELTGLPEVFRAIGSAIIGMVPGSGALMALAQQFDTIKSAALGILEPIGGLAGLIGQLTGQTNMAAAGLGAVGAAGATAAGGMNAAAAAAERETASLRGLISAQSALVGAGDALVGQQRRLAESIDANGRSLDRYSASGRANRAAIMQEVGLIEQLAAAKEQATGSAEAGDRVMRNGIAALRESAIAAGFSAKAFDALAKSLGLIPNNKKVRTDAPGADKAKKDLEGVNDAAKKVPKSTKTRTDAPNAPKTKGDLDDVTDAAKKIPKSTKTRPDAPNADNTRRDLEGVDDAARKIPGSTRTNVTESGASATESAMRAVQSAISAIDRSINIHTSYTSSGEKPNGGGGGGDWATGGYIRGPGTSTSDSIPAMLSDGEYVIRAAAVDRIGVANLHRLNAGMVSGFKKGGKVRASSGTAMVGGQPYAAWAKQMLPGFLANNQQWIEENLPRLTGNTVGTGAFYNTTKPTRRAKEKDAEYKQRVNAWKNEQQTIKRQFDQTVRSEKLANKWGAINAAKEKAEQDAADRQRGLEEWAAAVREQEAAAQAAREAAAAKTVEDLQNAKAAFWQSVTDSLRAASSFSTHFTKAHGSYASDVERLTAANQAVEEARKALNSAAPGDRAAAAKNLADALKEVAAAQAQVNASDPKPANVIKSFQERAAAAEKYQRQVTALQQAGLNNTILEQIATMGPDDAQAMIDSLSGMTAAQIQQLNAAQGRIDTAAITLGSVLSSGIYDPAIAAARANPNYTVAVEVAPQAITIALDGRAMATAMANYNRQTGRAA